LQELRRKFEAFASALEGLDHPALAAAAKRRVAELSPVLKELIRQVQASITGVPYPFPHSRAGLTLEQYAHHDNPGAHQLAALHNEAACQITRLLPLYEQVLGRLAGIALKVEEQIGSVG